ncbi:MAG: hypothetical protein HZB39_01330 [Planctomycetes bacterium]|nr:hypothetical protein [Planctomycetota bacterium]
MSRVLAVHLAREMREQRFVLCGSAVVLVLAATTGALPVARGAIHPEHLRLVLSFVGAALFLVAIAGDLLSGDAARGTRGFLARTPRGLGAAFRGKLAFLLLTAPVLPLLGLGLGSAVATLRDPALARAMPQSVDVYVTLPLLLLALWTFTASAFVKRAVLALPMALLMLSPVIGITLATLPGSTRAWKTTPFWCTWLETPGLGLAYLTALGAVAGHLAYVRRPRAGALAIACGMPLLLVPGLVELYLANTPAAHELRLYGGRVDGPLARFFAQDARGLHHWFVAVDLRSGRLTRLDLLDAEQVYATDPSVELPLPDASIARVTNTTAVVEKDGVELAAFAFDPSSAFVRGFGMQLRASRAARLVDEPRETLDFVRRVHVREPRYLGGGCLVLEDAWLVGDRAPRTLMSFSRWRLRDPATGAERVAPGLRDGDHVVLRLLDGRLVVEARPDRTRVESFLVDLRDGSRTTWRLPEGNRGPGQVGPALYPTSARLGRDWLFVGSELVSLAPGETEVRLDAPGGRVIDALDAEHLLIGTGDGRELSRLHVATGRLTRIYPR